MVIMAIFRFENLRFDPNTRRLEGPNDGLYLRHKVNLALELLAGQAGRTVDQGEFFARIWPETHVDERALPQVITELRSALEQVGGQRSWIRTIPRRGYCMESPVVQETEPLPLIMQARTPKTERTWRRTTWLSAAIGLVLVLGLVLRGDPTPRPSLQGQSLALLPVINRSGDSEHDWMRLGLMDMLRANINTDMEVIDSAEVVSEVRRLDLLDQELTEESHLVLARTLGQPILVGAIIFTEGQDLVFEFRTWVNGELTRTRIQPFSQPVHVGAITHVLQDSLGLNAVQATVYPFENDYVREVYQNGVRLFLSGSFNEAIPHFEICTQQDPGFWYGYEYLTRSLILTAQFDAASKYLNQLRKRFPGSENQIAVAMIRAELLYEMRQLSECANTLAPLLESTELSPRKRAHALELSGTVHSVMGKPDQAEQELTEALEIYRNLGHARGEVSCHRSLARFYQQQQQHKASINHLLTARPIARAIHNPAMESALLVAMGNHYYYQEDYSESLSHFEAALAIRRELGDQRSIAVVLSGLGSTFLALRRFEKAEVYLKEALATNQATKDTYNETNQHVNLGYLSLVQGDFDTARQRYTAALTVADLSGDESGAIGALIGLAEVEIYVGDAVTAASHLRDARRYAASDERWSNARLLYYEAAVDYLLGNAAMALDKQLKARDLMTTDAWTDLKDQYLRIYQAAATGGMRSPLPFTVDPFLGPDA